MHAQNHRRPERSSSFPAGVVASWREQPLALAVLRAFLGVTFLYAGAQKFADPTFFDSSSPQWIGAQLHGFAQSSPLRPVLLVLAHVPTLSGLAIALLEMGIGIATILGIVRIAAAAAGFAVSVLLWLSATWNVHPYFLGSDSIYAVAWFALLVGILESRRDRDLTATAPPLTRSGPARRDLLRGGAVAAASILIGAVAHVFAGRAPTARAGARSSGVSTGSKGNSSNGQAASGRPAPSSPSASPEQQVKGRTIAS